MATGKTISFPKGQRSSASAARVAALVKHLFEASSTRDREVITRAHKDMESVVPGITKDEIRRVRPFILSISTSALPYCGSSLPYGELPAWSCTSERNHCPGSTIGWVVS